MSGYPWPAEHNYALRLGFKANEPEPSLLPLRTLQVRRVMPGCWQVWCRRCAFSAVTGIVAHMSSWERAMSRANQHMAEVHGIAARVMTSADPCPPDGTVVRDDCGREWVNSGCYPSAWIPVDGDGDSESWTKVAGNYGPATVIEWGDDDG